MLRLISAASALALTVVAGAAQAQDFRTLARQDLQAAHDQLRDNHPAAVIPGAAGDRFRSWLDAGLAEAQAKAGQVQSGDTHAYLMRYYANGFRDGNIAIRPTYEGLGPFFAIAWPGFTTRWSGNQYEVAYVRQGLRGAPPIGSVLVSCNGVSAEDLARSKLDLWEGDLNTESGRVRTAPYLLWNRNNTFATGMPQFCTFRQGRREREYELKIQPIDAAQIEAAYRGAVYMPGATPLAIETINGRPWINVHSLADNADWAGFFGQVESQVQTLRGPQGFVIDLRGAEGSSMNATARGYGLANRIWTPEFTAPRQPEAGTITYRATPANRQWFVDTLARMQADPRFVQESASVIEQTAAIVAAFDAALAAGQQTFAMPGRPLAEDTGAANPVQGPVVVLVDGGCTGGCLDVLDMLTRLPNVRLAGSTTGVDSIFIEPTVVRLPSNYADLSYGHKAWTTRQRGDNQPYQPAQGLAYTGNPADETAVRTWVGTLFQ